MSENFPKIEEIRKGINELLLIKNWDRFKINEDPEKYLKELDKFLLSKLGFFPRFINKFNFSDFPFKFYRLRKFDRNMNTNLISEYSYPPVEYVKSIQRANLPNYPVFYCTNSPGTAIIETIKNGEGVNFEKDVFFLSEWQINSNAELNVTPFFFESIEKGSIFNFWQNENKRKLKKMLTNFSKDQIDSYLEVLVYLSNLFVFENTYPITSFIAHEHIYAKDKFSSDMFVYPSFQSKMKTVNYAIHPNVVIEHMKLKSVYNIRVNSIDFEKELISYSLIKTGDNLNGKLLWKSIDPKDLKMLEKLKSVFGDDIKLE
ncbi:hypothetical protein SAMN04489724_2591 [Algoriphagus locisalis]|uniref:RES domain-containing protein n=1 Tax=Algoriphagus locisalis TaxID=305507 RepID=A0A1I7BPD8_9BACT|nr:hypothetical protein [Algoriphagus locisalis]SFT89070.1 hypothetical protein SAMN04489724_2591 [Algoriphagus locisalis]